MKIKIEITKKYFIVGAAILLIVAGSWYIKNNIRPALPGPDAAETLKQDHSSVNPASAEELSDIQVLAEQKGARAAYASLLEKMAGKQTQGHDLAHLVGLLLYQQEKIKGLSVCDANFAFGCYHGFLGELIKKEGETSLAAAENACRELSQSGPVASCVHGIGHGVLGYTEEIASALGLCNKLASAERVYCFDGVYMEHFNGIMKSSAKVSVDYADPWKFCLSMPEGSQGQCVRNQILFMLYSHGETAKAVKTCLQLAEVLKSFCVSSVGLFAAQRSSGSLKSVETVCKNFSAASDRDACVTNAAQEFVFEKYPANTAKQLCLLLDTAGQQGCIETVDRMTKNYGSN